jgi:hypothetical protein
MPLEATIENFPATPYLLPPPSSGAPRRSSFTDGRERALVFFWESPAGRSYLIRTQAPYVTRLIQSAFGTGVDGKFGELTRRAIEADGRATGYFGPQDPTPMPATGPLMAYALAKAIFNGGRVAFPAAMEYPDVNRPVLATNPQRRDYTYLGALDIALGREVPMVQSPTGGQAPSTANEPPPPASAQPSPSQIPGQPPVNQPTAPAQQPGMTGQQPTVQPAPAQTGLLGSLTNALFGSNGQPGPSPDGWAGQNGAPGANGQPGQNGAPSSGPGGFSLDASGSMFAAITFGPGGSCPKGFIGENGECKLYGYGIVDGTMRVPNKLGGQALDFANPNTYQLADRTPGLVTGFGSALLGAMAAFAGGAR